MGAEVSNHPRRVITFVLVGLLLAGGIYLGVGPGPGWAEVGSWLTGKADEIDTLMLGSIRLPRLLVAMFAGAFAFWLVKTIWSDPQQSPNKVIVQNQESICAGMIAGAALVGVCVMAIEMFLLN